MIVIGSNTSDNGKLRFTEDVSHFMEFQQNRQLALLKRSAKNKKSRIYGTSDLICLSICLSALLKSASNVHTFASHDKINYLCLKCTEFEIGLKCIENWSQMYRSVIGSETEFCTFEADSLYI